jgi:hypothetical protein
MGSFWQKFLLQQNFLSDSKNVILNTNFYEDKMMVFYSEKNELHDCSKNINILLACFTTSNARVRLYKEMVKIGNRLLYCDTDSLIYISKTNEYDPPLSENLGDFSDELDGSYIYYLILRKLIRLSILKEYV